MFALQRHVTKDGESCMQSKVFYKRETRRRLLLQLEFCVKEGSHLDSIHSDEESDFVGFERNCEKTFLRPFAEVHTDLFTTILGSASSSAISPTGPGAMGPGIHESRPMLMYFLSTVSSLEELCVQSQMPGVGLPT